VARLLALNKIKNAPRHVFGSLSGHNEATYDNSVNRPRRRFMVHAYGFKRDPYVPMVDKKAGCCVREYVGRSWIVEKIDRRAFFGNIGHA